MLSPNSLERATPGYRRGYRDGYSGAPKQDHRSAQYGFYAHDYLDGYHAGANDRHWDDKSQDEKERNFKGKD